VLIGKGAFSAREFGVLATTICPREVEANEVKRMKTGVTGGGEEDKRQKVGIRSSLGGFETANRGLYGGGMRWCLA